MNDVGSMMVDSDLISFDVVAVMGCFSCCVSETGCVGNLVLTVGDSLFVCLLTIGPFVVGAKKILSWIMHYDLCPYAAGVAKSMVVMLGAIDVHMSSKGGLLSELYRAMRARVCVFLSRLGCHDDGLFSFYFKW